MLSFDIKSNFNNEEKSPIFVTTVRKHATSKEDLQIEWSMGYVWCKQKGKSRALNMIFGLIYHWLLVSASKPGWT